MNGAAESPVSIDAVLHGLEVVSIIIGGGWSVFKLGRVTERFEAGQAQMGAQIKAMQDDLKTMSNVLVELALQKQRLDAQAEHIVMLNKRFDELRRGEGLIR